MRVNNPPMPSTEITKNDTGLNKERKKIFFQESDSLSFEIECDSSFELIEVEEEQMLKNPQPAAKEECIKNNPDDEIDFFSFSEDMGNKLAEGQVSNNPKPSTKGKYESKGIGRQPFDDHDSKAKGKGKQLFNNPKPAANGKCKELFIRSKPTPKEKNATFVKNLKNQSNDIDEVKLDKKTLVTLENSDKTKEFSFQLEPMTKDCQQLQISELQEEVDGLKYQLERKHLELDAQWTTYQYLCKTIDAEEEKENSQQVQINALLQKIDGLEKANAGLKGQLRTQKKTIEEKESLNKELKLELKDLRWSMKRQSDYFYQMEDSKEENEKEKELLLNKELKLELNDLKLSMIRQMDYFYQMEKDLKSDISQLKQNHQGKEKMKDIECILEQMYMKDSSNSYVIEDMKKDIDQLKENEEKQQKVRQERNDDDEFSALFAEISKKSKEKKKAQEEEELMSALFLETSEEEEEEEKEKEEEALEEELISALFLNTSEEEEEALEEEKIISALFTEKKTIKAKEIIKAKELRKLKKRIEEKEKEREIASESSAVREGELDDFFPGEDNDNCKKNGAKFGEHNQRSSNRRDLKRTTRRHHRKNFTSLLL